MKKRNRKVCWLGLLMSVGVMALGACGKKDQQSATPEVSIPEAGESISSDGAATPEKDSAKPEESVSSDTAVTPGEEIPSIDAAIYAAATGKTSQPEVDTAPYQLKEVVVLSRHNIRAPLSSTGSLLQKITPLTWHQWSAGSSELTLKGGVMETMMGQCFRKWLEKEELIPENYRPEEGEVRFYANSRQRTIATAQYFSTGMLPVANVPIEYHMEYEKMDPVFNPVLTYVSDAYNEAVQEQVEETLSDSERNIKGRLQESFDFLSYVVDYKESEGYKNGEVSDLTPEDIEVVLEEGKEPAMTGSLKTANTLSDALTLQYYEEKDDKKAAFGKDIFEDEWFALTDIKNIYSDILFSTPLMAVNVAHPLLEEIAGELEKTDRKFTFLCGHDSNIASVLSALDAEFYVLPGTNETTPIGGKLVFEKWENKDDRQFIRIRYVYAGTEQIRSMEALTPEGNPPMSYDISFEGLERNGDGLYEMGEFMAHLKETISEYDELKEVYGEDAVKADK